MRGSQHDRDSIRQYLLGRLNDREDLESDISETILMDDDVSALAESVEDEIIEGYVEGTLDPADRLAVDNYFLAAAERKERLHFERLLRNHFEKRPQSFSDRPVQPTRETDIVAVPTGVGVAPVQRITYRPAFYLALAALVVVAASGLAYVSGLRNKQASLEHDLEEQRSQIGNPAQQASLSNLPMVALTLVSERSRGGGQVPSLEIKGETQRIIVEIALSDPAPVPYAIELESRGSAPVWKATLLPVVSASGDARLVFDVPGKLLEQGHYSFLVASLPPAKSRRSYYDFDVAISH
jgi:hypothetical protein